MKEECKGHSYRLQDLKGSVIGVKKEINIICGSFLAYNLAYGQKGFIKTLTKGYEDNVKLKFKQSSVLSMFVDLTRHEVFRTQLLNKKIGDLSWSLLNE